MTNNAPIDSVDFAIESLLSMTNVARIMYSNRHNPDCLSIGTESLSITSRQLTGKCIDFGQPFTIDKKVSK